jgi:hypothetical protein
VHVEFCTDHTHSLDETSKSKPIITATTTVLPQELMMNGETLPPNAIIITTSSADGTQQHQIVSANQADEMADTTNYDIAEVDGQEHVIITQSGVFVVT